MSETVIKVENLAKRYQLGSFGYGSLQNDLAALWARLRGKEDPNTKIGEVSRFDRHGEFWALRDVSFEVKQGERLGILGRNGAGKSTLLKILSRVTSPTEGRVKLKGRVASLLEVGTGFNPELTGRENVYLNGAIMGMKRYEIRQKFDEIVEFSGIPQFIDTPVKRYSSGMKVKLAFAVAAHLDSEILIADEVLAVGDADFQKKSLGKMEDISNKQGRTVLFVSHNLGAVKTLCTTGLFLQHGAKVFEGNVYETVATYLAGAGGGSGSQTLVTLPSTGSPVAEITSLRLLVDGQHPVVPSFDVFSEVCLEVCFTLLVPVKGAHLVLECLLDGGRLFTALETSDRPEILDGRAAGDYRVQMTIPAGFFLVGDYNFTIALGNWGHPDYVRHENVLPVEVVLQSRPSEFHQAAKRKSGKVNSPVRWKSL